jgi:hypothetical protein
MAYYRIEIRGWESDLLTKLSKELGLKEEDLIVSLMTRSLVQVKSELLEMSFKKTHGLHPVLEVHFDELRDPRKNVSPREFRVRKSDETANLYLADCSMAPDFPRGTWVFFDTDEDVKNGDLVYYKLTDGREGFRRVFFLDNGLSFRFEHISKSKNSKWQYFERSRDEISLLMKFQRCVLPTKKVPKNIRSSASNVH